MKKYLYHGIVLSLLALTILSGCGGKSGGSNPDDGAGSVTKYFAYVANLQSNTISAYDVGSDGTLSSVGSPVSASDAGGPRAVAADPAGQFLYVANGSLWNYDDSPTFVKAANVSVFKIGSDGTLSPAGSPVYSSVEDSTYISLAVDPAGQFVYVADGGPSRRILTYRTNSSSGALSLVGNPKVIDDFPESIAVKPAGRFVYVAANGQRNTDASHVWAFQSSSGELTSLGSILTGSDTDRYANPGSMAVDPTGHYICVVKQNGVVSNLTIGSDGTLSPAASATAVISTAVTIDPTGQFVYVANGSGTVSAFKIESGGTLTPVDGNPFGSNLGTISSITVDPAGNFLYVANQGSWSGNNLSQGTVSAFKIDPSSGALSLIGTFNADLGPVSIIIVKKKV
jgi:3-carboxymuconate cyclase